MLLLCSKNTKQKLDMALSVILCLENPKWIQKNLINGGNFLSLYELMQAWISSRVFPLVSGTNFATNRIVKRENPAYKNKVPAQRKTKQHKYIYNRHKKLRMHVLCLPGELQLIRKLKVYETIQAPNQFNKTTKLPAVPFTFMGKICEI
ncbi:hypothetical protein V8G54_032340 [Vigna mungo]|uniref:Uncharacterized protein n=1 Tax=Vigna mungo TaxID=3915 RepID=A0AAQ3RHR8_VIGMU